MKKISISIIIVSVMIHFVGCAPTMPSKSIYQDSYSIVDVKTFSSIISCDATQVTEIEPSFVGSYCKALEKNIKLALQKENHHFVYDENHPDLLVNTTLEEIHGGNASARFWVGFGAGRAFATVYVKVIKNGAVIAERRITETTSMPNPLKVVSNEDTILSDAPQVAQQIAKFVRDPVSFEEEQAPDEERGLQ